MSIELALAVVQKNIDSSPDAEGGLRIRGRALMLHEMVSKLVDNALTYSPQGGFVAFRLEAETQGTLFEILDSSPGNAASKRDKVFMPLTRPPSTMELNGAGTRLSLAIVREVATSYGAAFGIKADTDGAGLKVSIAIKP